MNATLGTSYEAPLRRTMWNSYTGKTPNPLWRPAGGKGRSETSKGTPPIWTAVAAAAAAAATAAATKAAAATAAPAAAVAASVAVL